MQTFALVGKTGTGKSYRSLEVARENGIQAIIDDGLLISESRILAGSSAKHEKTRIASVKRALFSADAHALSVKSAIEYNHITSILILGTSEKMVNQIASRLGLGQIEKFFYIEDIASPEEIEAAAVMRNKYGNHIIPVPVFEVKKQFSGYFLRSLLPQGRRDTASEKTIIRPTYSYLGSFKISPKVFADICKYEAQKIDGVTEVLKVKSAPDADGYINIFIEVSLNFPCDIQKTATEIQQTIETAIEGSTSIIVKSTDVSIKALTFS